MTHGEIRFVVRAGALVGLVVLAGCAASEPPSSAVIADRGAKPLARVEAIRDGWSAVERGDVPAESLREQLKRAAWSRGSPVKVRLAALEELLKDEANLADTENMFRLMLPTETNFDVIALIGNESASRAWVSVTPSLVRSWSRRTPEPTDAERPERRALMKLHPDRAVEDVVFDVFAGRFVTTPPLRERDRVDAWGLLQRIDAGGARTKALLTDGTVAAGDGGEGGAADSIIEDVRAAARSFGCVPRTGEQLQWLRDLRAGTHAAFWRECEAVFAGLSAEQRGGFELRHLAPARWASVHRSEWLGASREALIARVGDRLRESKRHYRSGGGSTKNELLPTWEKQLSWGDALSMLVAVELRDDPGIGAALFAQALEDRADTSTEHGGVFDVGANGRFVMYPFAPRATQRLGDRQFSAPEDMLKAGAAGLFHYHLHVQSASNGEYAGPSGQDLEYAKTFGRACLVFTSVREDVLNIDYYQPDGAMVDLGEVRAGK